MEAKEHLGGYCIVDCDAHGPGGRDRARLPGDGARRGDGDPAADGRRRRGGLTHRETQGVEGLLRGWRRRSSARWCAATGSSMRARTPSRRRCWRPRCSGRPTACRTTRAAWLITVASRRLTDAWRSEQRAARPRGGLAAGRRPSCRGGARGRGRTQRRHADAAVPVLPPVAVAAVTDRADAARRRRPDDRRDRAGVPGAGGDDGPAHQPRQGDHQGRRRRASRCRPPSGATSACASCSTCST